MVFRHVIECLGRKQRALLLAQLQTDSLTGENWSQLWSEMLSSLAPDETAKVMLKALHVAAREDVVAGGRATCSEVYAAVNLASTPYGVTTACGLLGTWRPFPDPRSVNAS
jgi:hypothetical protein